jgi:hypothetical protein
LKSTVLFLFLLIVLVGFVPAVTFANAITVQNASFEITNPLDTSCGSGCAYNLGPIPDWTITPAGPADPITHLNQLGSFQPGSLDYLALPDGPTVAYSDGGTISQTLTGTTLLANTVYVLSVDVGHRLDRGELVLVTDYSIALYAGDTLLNSFSASNGLIPIGTFANETLTFTSGATVPTGDLRIVLSSAGLQTNFDDVTLAATDTPEPASLTLLAAGLGLMILVFRRR